MASGSLQIFGRASTFSFCLKSILKQNIVNVHIKQDIWRVPCRLSNTLVNKAVEKHRKTKLSHTREAEAPTATVTAPRDYKFVHPDFLPNPEAVKRDRISEMLERRDMIRRRALIDIPEFYVGSILAVTVSDKYAPAKMNRFVGICIQRRDAGLRANFTLRNVVDGHGIEIRYEMYNPTIQRIEVIRLEKRLDEELFYLRDAPAQYSTFPLDMDPVTLSPGAPVPVNQMKVKLGPRPWCDRWERYGLKGIEDLGLKQSFYDRMEHPQIAKRWLKHDLMKEYRDNINDVEAEQIMSEVYQELQAIDQKKGRQRRGAFSTAKTTNSVKTPGKDGK